MPRPSFAPCGARPPALPAAPTGVVAKSLPHLSAWSCCRTTGARRLRSSMKASPSWTAQASPHRKPGVSRRKSAPTGGGYAPHYRTGAWAPIFAWAKISLWRPPARNSARLGGQNSWRQRRDALYLSGKCLPNRGLRLAPYTLTHIACFARRRKRHGTHFYSSFYMPEVI